MERMSGTELFVPRSPRIPERTVSQVTIPAPLKQESQQKMAMIQIALIVGMPVLMITMMVIMFQTGMRSNPMMIMMMSMMMISMLVGVLMPMLTGNGEKGDVDTDRQNYFSALAKNRKVAHAVGRSQFAVQEVLYPSPRALPQLVRTRHQSMWTASPPPAAASSDDTDDLLASNQSEQSGDNYLKARVGVGMHALSPSIQTDTKETVAPEHLEPVTLVAYQNFIAVQNVVPNAAMPVSLDYPAIGLRGHVPYRNELVRGMVMSMAYNHSPTTLMLGVVADPGNTEWDWIKWLPHAANTFEESGPSGFTTLRWSSFADACQDLATHHPLLQQDRSRMVVIVDLPNASLRWPERARNLSKVTFIVVRSTDDTAITTPENNFHVSGDFDTDRMFSAFDWEGAAKIDEVPRHLAENFARAMSPLRPPKFGVRELSTIESQEVDLEAPTAFDALEISSLEKYDLRDNWRKTDTEISFEVPIGFEVKQINQGSGTKYVPTGQYANLDILQLASGGTGPHGLFSGGTGTGKSFLLKMIILMMCLRFSPRRLNIIAADFKGGATFNELASLPHFQANLTNLEGAHDMVSRTRDVLEGENIRRQEIFKEVEVEDIHQYRKKQKTDPDLPDIPDLLFVADELREFLSKNTEYRAVFASIAAVGRSTGIHLFLGSQFIDQSMLGEAKANFSFGVSLKVKESMHSTMVIGKPDATRLPATKVAIMHHQHLQDDHWTMFQGFDHSQPYIKNAISTSVERAAAPEKVIESTLAEFTLSSFAAREQIIEADENPSEPEVIVPEETHDDPDVKDHFTALLDLVMAQGTDYVDTYTMWTTPMSVPMTFNDVTDSELSAPDSGLSIRIGDIDSPREHRRIPMEMTFDSAHGHVAVVGAAGTGRSTVIKTMIASSALRYPGTSVSWFIYDYSGLALSSMETYPNVAIYGTRDDVDIWDRIQGEVRRLSEYRGRIMSENRIGNVDEYFAKREELGYTDDAYGYIMVAVDGMSDYLDSIKMDPDMQDKFRDLMSSARRVGIYFVGTFIKFDTVGVKFEQLFTNAVNLYVGAFLDLHGSNGHRGMRDILNQLPPNDPGRVIDRSQVDSMGQPRYLHGRIILPVGEDLTPVRHVGGNPVYNTKVDFSSQIRDFGRRISESQIGEFAAPKLATVDSVMPFDKLWSAIPVDQIREMHPKDRPLPYGVETATFRPALLDPALNMRHVLISGSVGSGRTNTLRTIIQSITGVYSPEEARFIILDGDGELVTDMLDLVERGYMRNESYAMDTGQAVPLLEKLSDHMEGREPDPDEVIANPRIIAERSYFTGPEMFLIIDGSERFLGKSYTPGPFERFIATMPQRDVGVRVIFTLGAGQLPTLVSGNKGVLELVDNHDLHFLLHSGPPSVGSILLGARARFKTLPTGRVQLMNRTTHNGADLPQIQIAKSTPPPEPERDED